LLESKIQVDTAYQKQQETLIVWSESDNFDLALSFQEKAGCDEIWEKICSVSVVYFSAYNDVSRVYSVHKEIVFIRVKVLFCTFTPPLDVRFLSLRDMSVLRSPFIL